MRRKIFLSITGVIVLLIGIFIWRLDIPNWKKLDLEKLTEIPNATLVFDRYQNLAGTLSGIENRILISIDDVPDHVKNAFIAAEDLRFYSHNGIDIHRMFGALCQNIKSMSYAQGASTITQQVIKLSHLTSAKSLSRKIQEIRLALQLERAMDKEDILESYLNIVYFGRGAYGITQAAKTYFSKEVGELTIAEAALLAGIIKSPSSYAPHLDLEKSVKRRNSILETMLENGLISQAQCDKAKAESVSIRPDTVSYEPYGWYMDAVLSEAESVLGLQTEDILSGGYRIYTNFDSEMQNTANMLFNDESNFPQSASDGTAVQASFTVMDVQTGAIMSIVGGRTYEVRRGLNRSTQITRQPGSTFKPVSVYAAAIDAFGFSPTSMIEDTPRTFANSYTPSNAGGAVYGTVSLRQALSKSLNIATVDLADLIGIHTIRDYAARFGIELSSQDQNLSLALGMLTDGISPANLTSAYCALANGGICVMPHTISRIDNTEGMTVYEAQQPASRAIKASTAYMITDMLKTAATDGSAKALSSAGIPVAGKTGTIEMESGGTRDIWTVAYTPEIAITAWMGFDYPSDSHKLPDSEGGSGYTARLCASFLKSIQHHLSSADFKKPAGVQTIMIDAIALELDHQARLITEKTPNDYIMEELFHSESIPQEFSTYWTAPQDIDDLKLISTSGEIPILSFTVKDNISEYVLYRKSESHAAEIAVLTGKPGSEIRYADTEHDIKYPAVYTVIPRNAYLNQSGIALTGHESNAVQYVPGGFLNKIMGVGAAKATQKPTEYNAVNDQSLFG